MELANLVPLALVVLLSGGLIGCIGIGGVLLVPALAYIGAVPVHLAIACAMLSYVFTGVLGTVLYARRGSITWSMAIWLGAGAMPGAYLGAIMLSVVPAQTLELLIGVLIVLSGLHALRESSVPTAQRRPGTTVLLVIGLVTGFGSALTGTGGPLLLVPILVWLKLPVLMSVGLSQVIQIPVSVLATAGNFVYGEVDVLLGVTIAATLMLGVSVGARVAHSVSSSVLKRVVAQVLVAVGVLIVARIGYVWI